MQGSLFDLLHRAGPREATGTRGLPGSYPTMDRTDWVLANAAQIVLNGSQARLEADVPT